jgi:uncharacterized protein (DUF2141 family)
VSDGKGGTNSTTVQVTVNPATGCEPVNNPPTASITGNLTATLTCQAQTTLIALGGETSTDPDNDVLTYAWEIDGVPAGAGSSISPALAAGTYTVKLTVSDGKGGTNSTTVQVTVNPATGCDPVRTTGTLTVVKQVLAAPYASVGFQFQFFFNTLQFQLDVDPGTATPNSRTFSDLQPGNYTVREAFLHPQYYLKQVVCTAGNVTLLDHTNSIQGQETLSFNVAVAAGQDVVCVFSNDKRGHITVRKFEDLNRNGTLQSGEPRLGGWTFTVFQNSIQVAQGTTGSNGQVNFNNLIPGTYQICETPQTGWADVPCVNATVIPFTRTTVDVANVRLDTDQDGTPDLTDTCVGDNRIDTDRDGTPDACDSTPNGDTDNDGIDNLTDPTPNGDADNDGVDNAADICPAGPDNVDTDLDSTPDACDSTPNGDPAPISDPQTAPPPTGDTGTTTAVEGTSTGSSDGTTEGSSEGTGSSGG